MSTNPAETASRRGVMGRVLWFLLLSPVIGGAIGGLAAAGLVFISYLINPQSVTVGSGPAPVGVAFLAFLVWGFVGSLAGLAVGVLGSIVIAIRH